MVSRELSRAAALLSPKPPYADKMISPHTFEYFKSPLVASLQKTVRSYFASLGINLSTRTSNKNIRSLMFECFRTVEFREAYIALATAIAEHAGIATQDLVFQSTPTPRILRPGELGTSFHCDYWYGHGEQFLTIWTPISNVVEGNTFMVINNPPLSEQHFSRIANQHGILGDLRQLISDCEHVLPQESQCAVFGSKTIHGSPENTTPHERISFDFRLGPINDRTSTKDLDAYYQYTSAGHAIPQHDPSRRFLKYICGGRGISTTAQHILIEGVAKNLGLNIVAQEAEIERYGFPMLRMHAKSYGGESKQFDGIVVASKTILDEKVFRELREYAGTVFFALENTWLSKNT